jgi:hypothetical protein
MYVCRTSNCLHSCWIRPYTHTQTYIHTYSWSIYSILEESLMGTSYVQVSVYMNTHMYKHMHTSALGICFGVHEAQLATYTHTFTYVYVNIHIHTHLCLVYVLVMFWCAGRSDEALLTYTYTFTYVYVHKHIHIHTHLCLVYVLVCRKVWWGATDVHIHIYICICRYKYTYTYIPVLGICFGVQEGPMRH